MRPRTPIIEYWDKRGEEMARHLTHMGSLDLKLSAAQRICQHSWKTEDTLQHCEICGLENETKAILDNKK